jgi:hypothetical protein
MKFRLLNRWLPKKMCHTNKNVTKMGVIIKRIYLYIFLSDGLG